MPHPRFAYNALTLRKAYSGVENTIHGFIRAWAEHGPEPLRVYAPVRTPLPVPESSQVDVCAVRLPTSSRLARIVWEHTRLPRRLRQDQAALLHAPAYIAPLAAPCPVVLTVHDLHVFTHPACCTFENRLYYRLFLPRSIRRAAAIIVYSEHVRRIVAARYPDCADRLTVIPPGVDPDLAPVSDPARLDAVRAAWHLPSRFILFVGDLAPRKNLPRLLEAFARLIAEQPDRRDLHLVLAGEGGRNRVPLDARCARLGVADRVHALGYVPRADLAALYSLAAVLAFPSLDEGFGLPALEALACGCPVVCTPGGASEICGPAAACCDPLDTASITRALAGQLDDPLPRPARAEAGFARIARYSWPTCVAATAALYRDVCARNG
jgi:glycosyltransferase involved in cell wall biosynthesis